MSKFDRRTATGVAVLTAALGMCLAQTAGAAAAAGWTDLGTKGVYYQSEYRTHVVHSGGGSFKACITTSSSQKDTYHLYEQDAEKYDAKLVADVNSGGCWTFNNLDDYVDGDNNRAEFYIGTDDPGMKRVHYYD
ncbi:hypothetical protein ABZY90_19165 [Streptomyces sp. NPDC006422]|uniref:hypothetical protein n=1 Tax=unclassified Streptomyces TaxID=2593676 RepID=UPI0033A8B5D5